MKSGTLANRRAAENTQLDQLAELCVNLSFEDLGEQTIDDAKLVLFHNLTVALAARHSNIAGMDRSAWPDGMPLSHSARRLPDLVRSPLEHAVLNGSLLMSARAQHDEYPPAISHFGSTVIPPLLALSDAYTIDGRRFLKAMVSGYELGARIGSATIEHTRARGFRPTGIYGPIASAAACSTALGLSIEETTSALALGANQAAGLMQVWLEGTDEWRFHPAFAARNGLAAALLVAEGVQGAPMSLEGAAGYLKAYAGTTGISLDVSSKSDPWAISDVLLKMYPVCALNQAAMQQLLAICQREELAPQNIAEVSITLEQPDMDYPGVAAKEPPRTASTALMSMRYCAARAIIDGQLTLPAVWDLNAPEYLQVMDHVLLTTHDESERTRRGKHGASVLITLTDGRTLGDGIPKLLEYDRTSASDLAFSLLPGVGLDRRRIEEIFELVFRLEECPDVAELVGLLTSSPMVS
ncbi:2-methylcitrate dehydratase PrpD [Arthrobacter sp. CAN_A6]|uniref:MmgE/PrpD family protein n=1 Tax=Arthrobacter sp. CAN_A6 TaxID=2787721 RepID=UPI0018CA5AD4